MTLQELQGNVNINVMMKSERCNSRKPMSFSITPSAVIDVFYLDVRAAVVHRFACFCCPSVSQKISYHVESQHHVGLFKKGDKCLVSLLAGHTVL